MRKPRWYSVKKLHEEANIPAVRDLQIRLANEYPKRAKENKIESKQDRADPEKETMSKKHLSKHTGTSVLLMFFTSFNIVEKPELPSSNDLLQPLA